jgi:hypothetical protein
MYKKDCFFLQIVLLDPDRGIKETGVYATADDDEDHNSSVSHITVNKEDAEDNGDADGNEGKSSKPRVKGTKQKSTGPDGAQVSVAVKDAFVVVAAAAAAAAVVVVAAAAVVVAAANVAVVVVVVVAAAANVVVVVVVVAAAAAFAGAVVVVVDVDVVVDYNNDVAVVVVRPPSHYL